MGNNLKSLKCLRSKKTLKWPWSKSPEEVANRYLGPTPSRQIQTFEHEPKLCFKSSLQQFWLLAMSKWYSMFQVLLLLLFFWPGSELGTKSLYLHPKYPKMVLTYIIYFSYKFVCFSDSEIQRMEIYLIYLPEILHIFITKAQKSS